MKLISALLFSLLLILPTSLSAQLTASEKNRKDNKTLISVPVTVNDREGRYIPGLKKDDFTLYEDGIEQKIAFFATYDEPLSIALLLDTSGSTKNSLEKIKDAAKEFVELLNPNDQCLVATFDSQVNILNPLTSNQQTLKNSLDKIRTAEQEGTVMFRAIEQIAQKPFTNAQGRKVIVLLSDGKDVGSAMTRNELLNLLEESDISIYSLFYQTGKGFNKLVIDSNGTVVEGKENNKPAKVKRPKKKKGYSISIPVQGDVHTEEEIKLIQKVADIEAVNSLREISDTTAGRFYQSDTGNLNEVFKKIAGELRQQYRLGYYTKATATEPAAHEINVKVGRPDVVVRALGKHRVNQF